MFDKLKETVKRLKAVARVHYDFYQYGRQALGPMSLTFRRMRTLYETLAEKRERLMRSKFDEDLEEAGRVNQQMEELSDIMTKGPGTAWSAYERRVRKDAENMALIAKR